MARSNKQTKRRVPAVEASQRSTRTSTALRDKFESIEHIAEIQHACVFDTITGALTTSQGNIVMRGCAQTLRAAELQARFAIGDKKKSKLLDRLVEG
ncbi:MAG: hypothetical protein ACYSWU_05150 [Planctomycetota bacterium]|jgi:hypothetical protein